MKIVMHRRTLRPWLACLVVGVVACGGTTERRDPFMGNADGIASADAGVDDDDDDDDDSEGGTPLDFGDDTSDLDEVGCRSIDVLFVIDNSSSMAEQQGRLLASFPGFIEAITSTIEDVDSYHIGVVTSDAYAGNAAQCRGLGDLVTQTAGEDSSNATCDAMLGGRRYATEEDDLEAVFPCIAKVGTEGDSVERPVSAAVAALDPSKRAPGGCNEGFLRDDAILVIVVVTDDPPFAGDVDDAHPDGGDPQVWHDAVVAAKGGNTDATVVIGFVPFDEVWCMTIEIESPNLIDFVEAFDDRGILQSVCSPDYGQSFATTIETIHSTCDDFVPVG
jgi:hypothetical protein